MVDDYNAINFSTLQALGFYSLYDEQDEVINKELDTKVEPISFDDVIGKEYKVFKNSELYYKSDNELTFSDFTGTLNQTVVSYKENDLTSLYNDSSKGIR